MGVIGVFILTVIPTIETTVQTNPYKTIDYIE